MSTQHPSDLTMQELAKELHRPIIRRFEKRKVFPFMGNIWSVDYVKI